MSGIGPLVSVIIPCYNQAHYLGEAIESVRAQVHRGLEIEIVVGQRVHAARDPRRLDAWRTGRRWVEHAYGERLLDEVMSARASRWPVAVRSLATLVRHYPRGLVRRLFPRLAAAPAHR